MKRALQAIGVLVFAALALGIGVVAASEWGGEVIDLYTRDAAAQEHHTRLWVVEDDGAWWLRAGTPGSGWLARIGSGGAVEVQRGGVRAVYRATPERDPARRDRTHALMREKYGGADRLISLLRDGEQSVPVRLEPLEP
ncbi:MAG: hypothetical protein HKP27_14640 [Myxococcales bacterium]|nr:hypothetical protein [Myxococcales bacterium]